MPRNTAAGKAAAGPVNTSNGETVAVLTPQEELAVANAEIERLRELLKARDIPVLSDELSDTQRLATVLEALEGLPPACTSLRLAPHFFNNASL